MAVHLRKCRALLAPCVCVALVVAQLHLSTSADGREVGQFKRIPVNPTLSKFVTPVSPSRLFLRQAMGRFGSLLEPESELPPNPWLLDDSEPSALALYSSDAFVGELGDEMHSDDWALVARVVVDATQFIIRVTRALLTINDVETLREQTVTEELLVEGQDENLAEDEQIIVAVVYNIEEELATDDFEAVAVMVAEAYGYDNTIGEARHDAQKVRELIAGAKRKLMLSYELDALVLGAL